MAKIYLEIEIEVSGTVTPGAASSYNCPGHPDYIDDVEIESIGFEHAGKTYDLVKGLDPIAVKELYLNLTSALMDEMAEAVFEDQL